MECFYCKGVMKSSKTTYTINRKDYHLVIDNVPALICNQCGEPYFDESEVRLIQGLIKDVDKKTEEIHRLNVAV